MKIKNGSNHKKMLSLQKFIFNIKRKKK